MSVKDLSHLELTKIFLRGAVPLIRDFQDEFGEEAVISLLKKRIERYEERAEKDSNPEPDFENGVNAFKKFGEENGLTFDLISSDREHYKFNVTKCGYAELMEELDAKDLGPYFMCNWDFGEATSCGMKLERPNTIMKGDGCCNFHYKKP